jgi:hypothetical protein
MQRFRGNVLGILTMLIVQFLLGMGVNLFITIAPNHPGANPSDFFSGAARSVAWSLSQGPVTLIFHSILGLLLVINSIVVLIRAFQFQSTAIRVLAVLGAVGIIGAAINGASFLNYNHDANSYLMSVGFALAAVVYTQIDFMTPSAAEAPESRAPDGTT